MTQRRTLILLTALTLLAFGLRILSLDTQSMWRDEIDTLCFALSFWETLEQTVLQTSSTPTFDQSTINNSPSTHDSAPRTTSPLPPYQPTCQPTPGLSRIDPSTGLWATLRALLTLSGWNGPLYTLVMRPWIGLTGYSPFSLRFNSLIFGLLAVPLTYILGRRLMGTAVGLIGATLVTLSPHLVWYSQEAKMYGVILALGLLAVYGALRALTSANGGSRWWGVMVGATTVALYCHILTVLIIPLEVALGLLWLPHTRRRWRGALVALAFLTLPYLPLLIWQARSWLLPVGQATLFTIRRLDVMLEATFNGWGGNFIGEPWATLILAGLTLLTLFGLASVWLMCRETEEKTGGQERVPHGWRAPVALLIWVFLPLVGIWLISTRQPIFTNRYLIWSAPAFYLAAAAGIVSIGRQGRKGTLFASALLLIIVIGNGRALLHQATQALKPDFKAAAHYLNDHYRPGDLIVFNLSYMENNFDYYFSEEYDGWGAPAPGTEMPETDVDFYMRANTGDHRTIWLVLSEPQMWDPRGLIKAWLDTHTTIPPKEQAFAHVSVIRYQLSEQKD